jgi:competence protein ComEC
LILFGVGIIFSQIPSLAIHSEDVESLIDRGPMRIIARVHKPPLHQENSVTLQMKAESYFTEQKQRPLRGLFRLTIRQPETSISYGDLVEMEIEIHPFRQFGNPGVFQSADYLKRQGLFGTASLTDEQKIRKIEQGRNVFLKVIYGYRDEIRKKIIADISAPTAPILLAMILGESAYLNDPIRDAFTNSGTNHILSISGSHLAMVSFFIFGFSRFILLRLPASLLLRISLIKIPSQWAALITAIAVTLYTLLSGSKIATLRSLAMILAYLVALWMGRSVNLVRSISLAALLILILQPHAIFDISFQLSFLAILFIALLSEWWDRTYPKKEIVAGGYNKIKRSALLLFISSLGATLGTAPLTLYYFHQFSWVGFIANFIIIPYTAFVLLPLGLIFALASPFLSHFPLPLFNEAMGSFYFKIASFFADIPGAAFHFSAPHLLLVVLFIVILIILLTNTARPRWIYATVTTFFILFLVMGSVRVIPQSLRVTFIDVGQGDSALIEFPEGETLVVDGGSSIPFDIGRAAVTPFLWERKIRTIDYLIGTHPQMDHIGGFVSILKNFKVKRFLTNGMDSNLPFYQTVLNAVAYEKITAQAITKLSAPIESGGCKIVFLNPIKPPDPIGTKGTDMNNNSIVFRLSCPSFSKSSFLFTGDIENKAMATLLDQTLLQSDILKAPHHGSKGSLQDQFLNRVSPKIAIFSVGERNRYRHPHPKVVEAYEKIGAKIYRTDQQGAITVILNAGGFGVESFYEGKMKKVQFGRSMLLQEIENLKKGFSIQ